MGQVAEYLEVQSTVLYAAFCALVLRNFVQLVRYRCRVQGLFRITPMQGRLLEVVKRPSVVFVVIQ